MKTMLVPIDFSDVTAAVVKTAGDWARATGYRVHLFHVLPEDADLVGYESGLQMLPYVPPAESAEDSRLMQSYQQELAARGLEVTSRIVQGTPVLDIIDEAVAVGADVIVLGSHRHGALHHLLLGSVSGGVLRRTPCPVLIVPATKQEAVIAEHERREAALTEKVLPAAG
jgi:nucleotide-binding universal stress UspA family protein